MPVTRANGLRKFMPRRKPRRRTSVVTRARYAPKTARANRALIKSNAYTLRRVQRLLPQPVYTDYIYRQRILAITSEDQQPTFAVQCYSLVDFATWNPVMRISQDVVRLVATHIVRMSFNMRYNLIGSNYAQMTIFVATLRKDAASRDPVAQPLQSGADYIVNNDFFNARLNPSIWRIHMTRNVTLTNSGLFLGPAAVQGNIFTGNPQTTYKKGQFTIKPNMRIRAPAQDFWKSMVPAQLPPSQRYYLLTFIASNNAPNLAEGSQASIDMDMWATCKNTV